jgi:hypothetical protein
LQDSFVVFVSAFLELIKGYCFLSDGLGQFLNDCGTGGGGFFRSSLPVGRGWWCVVLSVFVLFRVCSCGGVSFGKKFLNDSFFVSVVSFL